MLPRYTKAVALLIVAAGALFAVSRTAEAEEVPPQRDVIVHLMEWRWTDIANECRTHLGPAGYGAVQVSPPQEHVVLATNPDNTPYPWWQRYQPVSYELTSRSGTRAEFAAMVAACHRYGVRIYVDAVINHMSGRQASGTGSGGHQYQRYNYPAVPYGDNDFSSCRRDISNWNDEYEIRHCELLGLVDLRTETEYVRGRLAAYLSDLSGLGVDGFRIDAARHIPPADLAAIRSRLPGSPYIYSEVLSDLSSGPAPMNDYRGIGSLIEHRYGPRLSQIFTGQSLGELANLTNSYISGPDHVVYVDSHDTQRTSGTLTYHDGQALYTLGNVFMLAHPYGRPMVMSSYRFGYDNTNVGPPSDGQGRTNTVNCADNTWVCEHRWAGITGMVGFRNWTSGAPLGNWITHDPDRVSFSRTGKGFVAINRAGAPFARTFTTSLPAGVYCDVVSGRLGADGRCTGARVTVGGGGTATLTVPAVGAVAIHVGAREGGPTVGPTVGPTTPAPTTPATGTQVDFAVTATTVWGQNVYVVGNTPALGNWNPAQGLPLSSATYPVWRGPVRLPAGQTVEYKYVKRVDGGGVIWESGGNRIFTVPSAGPVPRTETWR